MTFIEFFDKTSAENICACLACVPERVVLLGDKNKLLLRHAQRYEELFAARGHNVEFICKSVNRNNLQSIVGVLSSLVETYGDCAFGLTGGGDLFLTAAGIVYERYKDKNIQIHRYNIRNNVVYDCDNDGSVYSVTDDTSLSVAENIRIYGGDIVNSGNCNEQWDMNDEFKKDILTMWNICRKNVKKWNSSIGSGNFDERIKNDLAAAGLIRFSGGALQYKNPQVKNCLTKAGLALEMIIYLAALEVTDEDGNKVYNDARNGVNIDWDGMPDKYDTKNEIDVLLMRRLVPVFISCKNGAVETEELYKLNSVAFRFGRQYAKKALVATALDTMGEFSRYFRQRAADMNIRIIEGVQNMSFDEIKDIVKILWCD